MRTANPALSQKTFSNIDRSASGRTMTIQGTVNKTGILLALLVASASYTWKLAGDGDLAKVQTLLGVGAFGGLIVAMITIFKKTAVPVTGPIYAVLEGLFVGGISALFEMRYPGIVIQAVMLTFGTAFSLLLAYKTRMIKVTENFKLGIVAATGGIAVLYLVSMVMGFFGTQIPLIHESGLVGIGFSLFVVVIAALNLVLDFDFIENGAKAGAPAYMEWYGAFGLIVTLVWLYIEILRLLAKLRDR
ncbi:MAG: Bax inhibitor-1/YccA family protein [Deltaproteobacteria bacterium]|nr:Bax inhibitor-1/YccA family protein [Deltaproteobacteria bacterium]